MDTEQSSARDIVAFNQQVRAIWDQNSAFWDEKMAEEGNDYQKFLVGPSIERLLNLQAGQLVLEIGCGNGFFARRMAASGVHVIATDFSEGMIERAKMRTVDHMDLIEYRVVDATSEEQLLSSGVQCFDAVVCNMVLMDMATIEPLMGAIGQLLKSHGRFVFSIMHPCFNSNGALMMAEERVKDGDYIIEYAIRVTEYLDVPVQTGTAIAGQPTPHYYFHRPLHVLLGTCFKAGLLMDGIEEPALDYLQSGSKPATRSFSWGNYQQIPPALVVRMRPFS